MTPATDQTIYTIGHSNHSLERFMSLIGDNQINAIADVRSSPVSRFQPHFDKDALKASLKAEGIADVFLGRELGGRPRSPILYTKGIADYGKMAATAEFKTGVERLIAGAKTHRIAMMCSEHDPLDCHRCLLVARKLNDSLLPLAHILGNGSLELQKENENRLLSLEEGEDKELFLSRDEKLAIAYAKRARKVAFREQTDVRAAE